jgi:hypothetical protein
MVAKLPKQIELSINKDIHKQLEIILEAENFHSVFSVDIDTMERAKNLIDYFNMSKLILSECLVNPREDFNTAIINLITS